MSTNQNYTNQNLQNRSFKQQDLAGVDFSGSDLRGCDFTGANLAGANFERVITGQSRQQTNWLIATALLGPVALAGFSAIVAHVSVSWFSDRSNPLVNVFLGSLPILVLLLEIFVRDRMILQSPQATNLLGIAAISTLFAVMVVFTVGLLTVSLLGFSDGSALQGLFLLALLVISAIITFRVFNWLVQSIQTSCGTSFRKANLTDANFSQAVIQNTDFSFTVLTGICIFNWVLKPHNQFMQVYGEYLYLEPAHQKRHPAEGNLQPGELEKLLAFVRHEASVLSSQVNPG